MHRIDFLKIKRRVKEKKGNRVEERRVQKEDRKINIEIEKRRTNKKKDIKKID